MGQFINALTFADEKSGYSYRFTVIGEVLPSGALKTKPSPLEAMATLSIGDSIGNGYLELFDRDVTTSAITLISASDLFEFRDGKITAPMVYKAEIVLKRELPLGTTRETVTAYAGERKLVQDDLVVSMKPAIDITPLVVNFGFMQIGDEYTKEITIHEPEISDLQTTITGMDSANVNVVVNKNANNSTKLILRTTPLRSGDLLGALLMHYRKGNNAYSTKISIRGGAI